MIKQDDSVILIPETHTTQLSEAQLALAEDEVLVFLKLATMNKKALENRQGKVDDLLSQKGYFIVHKKEVIRKKLHEYIDKAIDGAC